MNIGFVDLQDDKEIESSIYHKETANEYVILKINDITNHDRHYISGDSRRYTLIIFQDKNNKYMVSLSMLNKCVLNILLSIVENIYELSIIRKPDDVEDVNENINTHLFNIDRDTIYLLFLS